MDINKMITSPDWAGEQIQRLEHVNRKLGGTNGLSKLAHQQDVSDPSDDDEDMSKLKLRFSPRTSVENLAS